MGGDIALDRLSAELGDVQRYDIVAALKALEKAGKGTFEVGRAGRKARFVWSGPARSQARTATRTAAKVAAKREPERHEVSQRVRLAAESPRGAELEHVFHLRPGFVAQVRLPADVTSSEVARFCQFLQALPFGKAR